MEGVGLVLQLHPQLADLLKSTEDIDIESMTPVVRFISVVVIV